MTYTLNARYLKNIMRERRIKSIEQLAEVSSVHRNTISSYLAGKTSPFKSSFTDIAKHLSIDPLDLIRKNDSVDEYLRDLLRKLSSYLLTKSLAIVLFGSRARGNPKEFSDIDLGLTGGEKKLSLEDFFEFKNIFDEMVDDYPVSFDLLNFDQAPEDFLLEAGQSMQFLAGEFSAFTYLKGYIDGKR